MDSGAADMQALGTPLVALADREGEGGTLPHGEEQTGRVWRRRRVPSRPDRALDEITRFGHRIQAIERLIGAFLQKLEALEAQVGQNTRNIQLIGQTANSSFTQLHTVLASAMTANGATLEGVRRDTEAVSQTVRDLEREAAETKKMVGTLQLITLKGLEAQGLIKLKGPGASGGSDSE